MNKSDIPELTKVINVACEVTGRKPLSNEAVGVYVALFKQYSMKQIKHAIQEYLKSDKGMYPLTPAAILEHIDQGILNAEKLVDMAHSPTCVTGYMARKLIGTWDLEKNEKQALATARRILKNGDLQKEVSRAQDGGLTGHEKARLQVFGIDPAEIAVTHRLN